MTIKHTIRKQLIQKRNSLTFQNKKLLCLQICDKILSSEIFNNSNTIASYISVNNEVDLSSLFAEPKNYVLPVIQNHQRMSFNHFNQHLPKANLIQNKFGILEPLNNPTIDSHNIDLCLLPLVGFNRNGDRIGMGGGYYDRYFKSNKQHNNPTILAGIAYDFQEDDTIQAQAWDIPLDMIFTNNEVIYCD